jgi:hypothetical protein
MTRYASQKIYSKTLVIAQTNYLSDLSCLVRIVMTDLAPQRPLYELLRAIMQLQTDLTLKSWIH